MFNPVLLIIYVAVSALVGFAGRRRSVGFSGIFTLSLFLSPIIVALVLLVSAPKTTEKNT